jgi:hypothetical protein
MALLCRANHSWPSALISASKMSEKMPITVKPTKVDLVIVSFVSRHTNAGTERAAGIVTWAGDDHVLGAVAAAWWLWCRHCPIDERRTSTHLLLTAFVASALPHLVKTTFNQRRPDRVTVEGHLHGVPRSGRPRDAFPSGHAIHIGALASAATRLPPVQRNIVWSASAGLLLTRIVLLAHWASDVAGGLAIGALIERALRPTTRFGRIPTEPSAG